MFIALIILWCFVCIPRMFGLSNSAVTNIVPVFLGGQNCIDNPDVSQIGTVLVPSGRQVVVPNVRLNCTVRVTHIAASLGFGDLGSNQPIIQMWRPSSPGSTVYNRIAQVQTTGEITIDFNHFFFNLSIPNSSDFEFLPGDVIGYYQPSSPRRRIWSIPTSGYTSYSNNANGPTTTIDISNVDNVEPSRQPLIELSFGKQIIINSFLMYTALKVCKC